MGRELRRTDKPLIAMGRPMSKAACKCDALIEEFLRSGMRVADVRWRAIDPDFSRARVTLLRRAREASARGGDVTCATTLRDGGHAYLMRTSLM